MKQQGLERRGQENNSGETKFGFKQEQKKAQGKIREVSGGGGKTKRVARVFVKYYPEK